MGCIGYQTRKKVVKYKEEVEKARRDLQLQEEKMIRVEESSKQDGNVTKPQAPPVDAKDMREDASAISLAVVQETFFEEMNNDINIDEGGHCIQ